MCTMVSCRGSTKPKENCPIAISDIVLLHNHVMQILAPKQIEKEIWDVCPQNGVCEILQSVCQAP